VDDCCGFGGSDRGDVEGRSGFLGGEAILPREMWTAKTLAPPFRPRLRFVRLVCILPLLLLSRVHQLEHLNIFVTVAEREHFRWCGLSIDLLHFASGLAES
jgi:hypothetical protein